MTLAWSLVLILGANLIAAFIVLGVSLKRDRQSAAADFLFFIAVPAVGFLIKGIVSLAVFIRRNKAQEYDFADLMTFQSAKRYSVRPNVKEELDLVSVEESVRISQTSEKRNLVRSILKRDIEKYSRSIHSALRDRDSETAHYAASAIMEVYRKMSLGVQRIEAVYEEEKGDVEVTLIYIEALWDYISSGILSGKDREQNIKKYQKAVEDIQSSAPGRLMKDDYIRMSDFYLAEGRITEAQNWAEKALERFESEDTYMNMLKVAWGGKDKRMFDSVMEDLRKSKVVLSDKSIDQVRFWIAR